MMTPAALPGKVNRWLLYDHIAGRIIANGPGYISATGARGKHSRNRPAGTWAGYITNCSANGSATGSRPITYYIAI